MKKFILACLVIIMAACSSDSNENASPNDVGGDGMGGSLARFALAGNYLYTVGEESLSIFDITSPSQPVFKGNAYIGFDIETLFALDDRLYIGSRFGMFIYDISAPENPLQLAAVSHIRSCDPVVSSGDFTYVTLHATAICQGEVNQLEVYNTENPLYPQLLTTVQMNRPIGLGLYGNYLLVADLNVIRILDVSDPQYPNLVSSIPVNGFDLIIRGDELFVIGDDRLAQYELGIVENEITFTEVSEIIF